MVFLALLLALSDPAETDPLIAKSQDFATQLAAGKVDDAIAPFDATMREKLPAKDLANVWRSLVTLHGPFQEAKLARVEQLKKFRLVYLTCHFERGKLEMKVAWNDQQRIAGLFFLPAGKYESPKYVDARKFESREVAIGAGLLNLPGTLTLPKGEGPFAAVVLVHGSGPHDRDETIGPAKPFRDLAEGLATRGVAVLRYEKRTKAFPLDPVFLSGKITVREETIDDAVAAAALLAKQKEIDPRRVFVLGHSLGGMLIPRIAERATEVKGCISLAGSTRPLEESIRMQVKYLADLDGKIDDDEAKGIAEIEQQIARVQAKELSAETKSTDLPLGIPASYWLDLRDYRPAERAKEVKRPMLFLQGERDYQVTMDDFAGWKKGLEGRTDVTFKSYPKLNHLFQSGEGKSTPAEYTQGWHVEEEVVRDIAEWIAKQKR